MSRVFDCPNVDEKFCFGSSARDDSKPRAFIINQFPILISSFRRLNFVPSARRKISRRSSTARVPQLYFLSVRLYNPLLNHFSITESVLKRNSRSRL